MVIRFMCFDDISDFVELVVPGVLRRDNRIVAVVGYQIGDIAGGQGLDGLLH